MTLTLEEVIEKQTRFNEIRYFEQDKMQQFREELGDKEDSSSYVDALAYNKYVSEFADLVSEGRRLRDELDAEAYRINRIVADAHESQNNFYRSWDKAAERE